MKGKSRDINSVRIWIDGRTDKKHCIKMACMAGFGVSVLEAGKG